MTQNPAPLVVSPVSDDHVVDKAVAAFERIREVLQVDDVPVVFRYMANVPAFVHDFFMNFRKFVLGDGQLDEKTRLLIAIAVAGQNHSRTWLSFLTELAESRGISATEIAEVLAVGATNAMYNTLFKFRDIAGTDVFDGMGVGLRAHTFQGTSLSGTLIELINVTLSDLNGCKPCTSAHVAKVRQLSVSDEAIYEAVQCAATNVAATQFLNSIGLE
ncbi:MAG: carboxymuconolactone decarboxylase family protein [Planctomycetaceae bacterium]|nr:carboxymuconolactone decarboxylase family protein [Planctomycetaceae bacterium]